MVFANISWLIVFLFNVFDILVADETIWNGVNERNYQKHLACKEGHPSAFCIPQTYNRDIGPWEYRHLTNMSLPWLFTMEIYMYDVQEIDDEKLTITFEVNFKIKWMEPRSQTNVSSDTWRNGSIMIDREEHYLIPLENMADLWIPAFELHHLELYQPQKVLKETANLRINATKFIRYIAKVKIVLNCQMIFDSFPFDSHTCRHQVGSYNYPKEIWDCTSSVHLDASQQRNLQYHIEISDLPRSERMIDEALSGNTWATCGFKIDLRRKKSQIFIQVYLTSGLLVVIAWVSFIIPPEVVPGRMGLLVTVFLMLITIFISIKRDAPPSNGFLNAADMFVVACICHVFLGFIEYAFVLLGFGKTKFVPSLIQADSVDEYGRHINQTKHTEANVEIGLSENNNETLCTDSTQLNEKWNGLDLTLLFGYPISFAIFCTIYLSEYLSN